MNISAKGRFTTQYAILRKYFGVDQIPINDLKTKTKEEFFREAANKYRNLTEEMYDVAMSLFDFFSQREIMSYEEFSKALYEEYGESIRMAETIRNYEIMDVVCGIDRKIKTIKGIMVFFVVVFIISVIAVVVMALMGEFL